MKSVYKISILVIILGIIKSETPEAFVVLPIRRIGTAKSVFNQGPCGAVKRLKADTLTYPGATLNFVWEVQTPEAEGMCTVSLSNGFENEENFEVLKPTDDQNGDGSFVCGRKKGFESKDFKLPDNYECDRCIAQWKWTTSNGTYYSCSDLIINGTTLSSCMSKCQNGGNCFNGKCICINGFSGEFCEKGARKKVPWLLILLIILALLLIAGIIYLILKKRSRKWADDNSRGEFKDPWDNQEYAAETSQPNQPNY